MTENEHNNMLNECLVSEELSNGYKVQNYIASPEINLHVFTIMRGNKIEVIGLPKPRSFLPNEEPQLESEIKQWGQYIVNGELFWKPISNHPVITDKKFKMLGVFIRVYEKKSHIVRNEGDDTMLNLQMTKNLTTPKSNKDKNQGFDIGF